MNKTQIDVLVMLLAFVAGGYLSMVSNPLIGIFLMIGILTSWSILPKVPMLVKSRIRK